MSIRLPSLESLRYFEVAARHLSFTLAAEELCISQSAVSQKIIQLEKHLGYQLFERRIRQLTLTEQGEKLYPAVYASFIDIRDTLSEIKSQEQMTKLTIYCMPSFAHLWLMPRLHDFHIKHPHIDVHFLVEVAEPNFQNEVVDVGICHGVINQLGIEQDLLFWDYVYPVASPEMLAKQPITSISDLSNSVLLHDSLPKEKLSTSWQRWLIDRGVRNIDCSSGYRFNQADLIVRAALDGRGVALGRHALVANDVAQGKLIPLFNDYERDDGIYAIHLKKSSNRPQINIFLHWLREQAATFEQDMGAFLD